MHVAADRLIAVPTLVVLSSFAAAPHASAQAPRDLHEAVHLGQIATVKTLLEQGADPNACSTADLMTPLHRAVELGQPAMMTLLLDKGAKANASCAGGMTPLIYAVSQNRVEMVKLLVARKADLDARWAGLTALMTATQNGRVEMVKLLLSAGADRSVEDDMGSTAYDWAVSRRRGELVELLGGMPVSPALLVTGYRGLMDATFAGNTAKMKEAIGAGADLNVRIDAVTPLEWAVAGGHAEAVALLLDSGANPNKAGANRQTPLMTAAAAGLAEISRLLLQHGADRGARNAAGQTAADLAKRESHPNVVALLNAASVPAATTVSPAELSDQLVYAALTGDAAKVEALLKQGAGRDAASPTFQVTPLVAASQQGKAPVARLLLDRGANVNLRDPLGRTPLIAASAQGQVEVVRLLLERGADVSLKAKFGGTALEQASREGHGDVAQILTQHGAKLDTKGTAVSDAARMMTADPAAAADLERRLGPAASARSRNAVAALIGAARSGDANLVSLLLSQGADIDGADGGGTTPLTAAIGARRAEVARLLIDRGARVNLADPGADTPLMVAAREGNADIAARLVEKGAQVNAANAKGETPLIAAMTGQSPVILELLIDHGAQVNAADKKGQTAFFFAYGLPGNPRDAANLIFLIQSGADPNARTLAGVTPLMNASRFSTPDVVRLLLDKGAAVNARDKDGRTALVLALSALHSDIRVPGMLVEHGADVNLADSRGTTPLMACSDVPVAKLLIERGARLDATDREGKNALHYKGVADFCSLSAARYLAEQGVPLDARAKTGETPFMWALQNGCDDVATMLFDRGADVNVRGLRGKTPLMLLAGSGDPRVVERMLARGADVNAKDSSGTTAMHLARSPKVGELLLARGAPVDPKAADGTTPLMAANNLELAEWLVAKGADVNARAADGKTVLMRTKSADIVRMLLQHGARVNDRATDGRTALMMAVERGDPMAVQFLVEGGADVNARAADGRTALALASRDKVIADMLRAAGAR